MKTQTHSGCNGNVVFDINKNCGEVKVQLVLQYRRIIYYFVHVCMFLLMCCCAKACSFRMFLGKHTKYLLKQCAAVSNHLL